MTDQLTDEAVKALLDRVPEFAGILRKQASLSRDLHLSSNLHNAADWMDYLARALLDARADAQAAVALALEAAAGIVRSVWGRCEALEDEAADKLANPEKLTEHEQGFWRGQKMVAKSIRRSIEMPLAPADGLAAVEALRKERDAFRRNLRETFEAMCAMRDAINEYIPMPSLESDLLQGPENSVFCTVVAQSVVAELAASEAARKLAEERLREAKLAFENVDAQVEDEGEFTERSWEQLRATLKEIDNG